MFKQICYTEITDLIQFKIHFQKSHRQPQCTLHLVCEDRVLIFWFDLRVFFLQATEAKMREGNSSGASP